MRLFQIVFSCICMLFFLFTTPALSQTTILNEDFESASGTTPPGNWSRSQNANAVGWEFGTASDISTFKFDVAPHTKFAASNDHKHDNQSGNQNDATEDYLISPSLDLTSLQDPLLSFDANFQQAAGDGKATVEVSTDGGNSWTVVKTLSESWWGRKFIKMHNYKTEENLKVAFHFDDEYQEAGGFAVDNVVLEDGPKHDIAVNAQDLPKYMEMQTSPLELTVNNNGTDTIKQFVAEWSFNGGLTNIDTVSNASIATGESYTFSHDSSMDITHSNIQSVHVEVRMPNMNQDANFSNNRDTLHTTPLSASIEKEVLLHEYAATWCQYCPDAKYILNQILDTTDYIIPVSIHKSDPMAFSEGVELFNTYITNPAGIGVPSGDMDHYPLTPYVAIMPSSWDSYSWDRSRHTVPVAVSASNNYNASSNEVYIDMNATFYGQLSGDLRFNAYVVEDSVSGGSSYDQANFFNNQQGHPYYGAGNPIEGYQHRHILRATAGGAWGHENSIPENINNGDQFSLRDTFSLNSQWQTDQITVVAFVHRYNSDHQKRIVLNAVEMELNGSSKNAVDTLEAWDPTNDPTDDNTSIFHSQNNKDANSIITSIYPQPVGQFDNVTIALSQQAEPKELSVDVYDIAGNKVKELYNGTMGRGRTNLNWNISNQSAGMYLIHLKTQHHQETRKMIITR